MHLGFIDSEVFFNDKLFNINDLPLNIQANSKTIYEVIRVIAGKPLFIEEHIKRLENSLVKLNIDYIIPDYNQFKIRINKLCKANKKLFGNIELRIGIDENGKTNAILGFIAHYYPEATSYIHGIKTKTLNVTRKNPAVKAKNTDARRLANAFIANHELYEVLLVNDQNELTEGSRSNLFLIKDNKIYTAPNNIVLQGITRLKVLQALKTLNFDLISRPIKLNELANFHAAFICGTSPGVLPLKEINNVEFDVLNPILREIIKEYNNIVTKYLSQY